jgi:hypothetical protein
MDNSQLARYLSWARAGDLVPGHDRSALHVEAEELAVVHYAPTVPSHVVLRAVAALVRSGRLPRTSVGRLWHGQSEGLSVAVVDLVASAAKTAR